MHVKGKTAFGTTVTSFSVHADNRRDLQLTRLRNRKSFAMYWLKYQRVRGPIMSLKRRNSKDLRVQPISGHVYAIAKGQEVLPQETLWESFMLTCSNWLFTQ